MKRFHVLVATDGSTSAQAAVTTAVRLPWPAHASGSAVVAKQVRADYRRSILLAALDRTAEFTARRASRAVSRRWPDSAARVVDAAPVDGILQEARRVRADVIVLGWRGHGAARRLLAGSVSHGVARRAPCPVLIVRRPMRELRHAVIGVDGSGNATRAVELLAEFTPARGAQVTLLTAVEAMRVPRQPLASAGTRTTVAAEVARINEERRAAARTRLSRAAKILSSAGWKANQVVTEGAPLQDLISAVVKSRADLLVVGAKGVTGLRRLLLGSVAEGALNRCPAPLLIVR